MVLKYVKDCQELHPESTNRMDNSIDPATLYISSSFREECAQ